MHILLVSMSANITRQLGMAPGGEFRAAVRACKEVPGCQLDLGDRPVEVTLQRAIGSLSWWKKLRLFAYILISHSNTISVEDVEKCKEKDMLEQLLSELAGEFPELSLVFVKERDVYMAARLRSLLLGLTQRKLEAKRRLGAAEVDPVVVVAVVGMGHVPGITANFQADVQVDVRELLQVPPRSRLSVVVRYGVLGGIVGAAAVSAYLAVKGVKWGVASLMSR
jgi:pheromone shutdown protein TraB